MISQLFPSYDPGCSRDQGTATNSVINTITSIVLVIHVIMSVNNSNNNNNNNNDNNNNNNDNNNVGEYTNAFVSMNMNTAMTMMTAVGGRRKRDIRKWLYDLYNQGFDKDQPGKILLSKLYAKGLIKKLYKCLL